MAKQNNTALWTAVIYGSVISILISLLGSIIGAILINREMVGESASIIISIILWILSSFTGVMVSIKLGKHQILLTAGVTVLIYLFVLIGSAILFFDGNFTALWQGIVSVIIGGGASFALCSHKNTGKRHKVKYRTR